MKIKYLLYSVLTTAVLSGCIDVLDKKDLSAITGMGSGRSRIFGRGLW